MSCSTAGCRFAAALGVLVALTVGAAAAQARENFYLGLGMAQQTISSSDLDGNHIFLLVDFFGNPVGAILLARPEDGSGLSAQIGYGFNENIAIEALFSNTDHAAGMAGLSTNFPTELTSTVLAVRLSVPLDKAEVFARLGRGSYTLKYQDNVVDLNLNPLGNTTLTGSGTAIGVGIELFFDALALELSITQHKPSFDTIDFGDSPTSLPGSIAADVQAVNLIFKWYAGTNK
ncbi:MAG: porin family protein [Candidatus Lambdaproteobacteria bacterium]|nr:porin family protein [Candidatus Lambdaproteobacteria bacterium]